MSTLILLRHGESLWNKANRFTGWVDIPLSAKGIDEALAAGVILNEYMIDIIFTSTLARAQQTAMLALAAHCSGKIPVLEQNDAALAEKAKIFSPVAAENLIPTYIDSRLNERFYGALQGVNKDEAREKYGKEQVHIWRRSFDVPPPDGESLAMTCERTIPCLEERIIPALEADQTCLVSAHGNSLRSIVMHIEKLTAEEILQVEIPTGQPFIYDYQSGTFKRQSD